MAILVTLAYLLLQPSGIIGSRLIAAFDGWRAGRALDRVWPELVETPSRLVGRSVQVERTIVEFIDYECPFCRIGAGRVFDLVAAEGADIAIRHLPLEGIHPRAREAAQAAICSEQHGVFAEAHASLLNEDDWLVGGDWGGWAVRRLGIQDTGAFQRCMADEETARRLEEDVHLADQLGIQGTPGFVTAQGVFGGRLDEALASLHVPVLTLADGVLFASGDHGDAAVAEIGFLGGGLFTGERRIVLVDRFSLLLLFIELPTGELQIQGGRGEGPGEFDDLAPTLGRGPDGPVAWDTNQRRATFYSQEGSLIATHHVRSGLKHSGREVFLGALDGDGALAFLVFADPAQEPNGAVVRRSAFLSVQLPDGDAVAQVREFPTTETLIVRDPPLFPYSEKAVLFGAKTYFAKIGDRVVVADTQTDGVVSYDRTGVAVMSMRTPGERRRVSRAQIEAVTESLKDRDRQIQERRQQTGSPTRDVFDDYVSSPEAPAIDQMLADWAGRLWLRQYMMPGDTSQHWTVWAGQDHVFSVELPLEAVLMDAQGDLLLLQTQDDLGVQQAVVRRIS